MFDRAPKLEKAWRRFPQAPLFARLADQYLQRGRLVQAQTLCEEGCERFPAYSTGFFVLCRCYELQRLWEEARTALDRGLRLDPDNPAGYRRLSRVYREMGNDTLALKCLERAAALDPLSETLGRELEQMVMAARAMAKHQTESAVAEPVQPAEPQPLPPAPAGAAPAATPMAQDEGDAEEDLFDGGGDHGPDEVVEDLEEAQPEAPETRAMDSPDDIGPLGDEPFGQVQPQPEWAADQANEVVPPDSPVEEPVVEDPVDDEVAALGAGLFEDESDVVVEPPPVPPPGPARRAPAETAAPPAASLPPAAPEAAEPLPVDLLLDEDVDEETDMPASAARVSEAGVSKLAGQHGDEFKDLLQDMGQDASDAEETEEVGEPVATVTLAELYARQGYLEQAHQIYERVLQADPDNEAARLAATERNHG